MCDTLIPDALLEAIRQRTILSALIGQTFALKREGREIVRLCRFQEPHAILKRIDGK